MAIEVVREYLKQWDADKRIIEFPTSSATVELAAQAAGCEPARIAKTLSFLVDDHAILIVMAGDVKVDNAKYKEALQDGLSGGGQLEQRDRSDNGGTGEVLWQREVGGCEQGGELILSVPAMRTGFPKVAGSGQKYWILYCALR